MSNLIEVIRSEWPVIKQAPWTITFTLLLLAAASFGFIYWGFHENLTRKNDLIQTLRDQLDTKKKDAKAAEPSVSIPELGKASTGNSPTRLPADKSAPVSRDIASYSPKQPAVLTENTAPGGIANSGTINGGAQVFNGPPPPHLTFTELVSKPFDGVEKLLKVSITTDRSISGAFIGVVCSGPIELVDVNQVKLEGSGVQQIDGKRLARNGVADHNAIGIAINIPAAFVPGQTLVVPLKSSSDVSVRSVFSIGN